MADFKITDTEEEIISRLISDEAIQEYIDMVVDEDDKEEYIKALKIVAKVKGIEPTESNIKELGLQFQDEIDENYVPTEDDLTFRETDTEKRIISRLIDDKAIQYYVNMVLEDGTEAEVERTLGYIARAKNIEPTESNLAKIKAQYFQKVSNIVNDEQEEEVSYKVVGVHKASDELTTEEKRLLHFEAFYEDYDDDDDNNFILFLANRDAIEPTESNLAKIKIQTKERYLIYALQDIAISLGIEPTQENLERLRAEYTAKVNAK